MNFPHRQVTALRHPEEDTIPETIKHFAQAVTLTPQYWDTPETITTQFEHEGHKAHFINTIVSYIQSLHDILYLWRIRVNGNAVPIVTSANSNTCRYYSSRFLKTICDVRRQPCD